MTHLLPGLNLMTKALRRRLASESEPPAPEPLDYPLLRRMSPQDLADLPVPWPAPRHCG